MEHLVSWATANWLILALIFSSYWGVRSAFLFTTDSRQRLPNGQKELFFLREKCPCLGIFFIATYQFLFNFFGSFAGWCCLYFLLSRMQRPDLLAHDFTGGDVLLFTMSLIGLTGHLPQVTIGFVQAVSSLAEKAMGKLVNG